MAAWCQVTAGEVTAAASLVAAVATGLMRVWETAEVMLLAVVSSARCSTCGAQERGRVHGNMGLSVAAVLCCVVVACQCLTRAHC